MQQTYQKRNIAYRTWISNLLKGNYIKQEGEFQSDYVEINDLKISRVNLIGNVVFKYESPDNNHIAITLDDSSSSIRLKAWKEDMQLLSNLQQGDLILVIGKVRSYNDELYVVPEVVKTLTNPNLELLRKIELLKEFGKPLILETTDNVNNGFEQKLEKKENHPSTQKILDLIKSLDIDQGANMKEIIEKSGLGKEAEEILDELLKQGEIYQPKPQYLKLLE
jgi:RPA family protein|tara:strand:- start:31211 stop:31876 length:666 start_codon:yes stop_codon:yes gene_type:complete